MRTPNKASRCEKRKEVEKLSKSALMFHAERKKRKQRKEGSPARGKGRDREEEHSCHSNTETERHRTRRKPLTKQQEAEKESCRKCTECTCFILCTANLVRCVKFGTPAP